MIETTLAEMREDYDWLEAFGFAGAKGVCNERLPEAIPGETCSVDPFSIGSVAEVYGSVEGEADVSNWVCYGRLHDGRYFALSAGCDYTGWD